MRMTVTARAVRQLGHPVSACRGANTDIGHDRPRVRVDGPACPTRCPITAVGSPRQGSCLGLGLGGFVDGIVLHQILQWHHMLTDYGHTRLVPRVDRRIAGGQHVWDGLFHASTWVLWWSACSCSGAPCRRATA